MPSLRNVSFLCNSRLFSCPGSRLVASRRQWGSTITVNAKNVVYLFKDFISKDKKWTDGAKITQNTLTCCVISFLCVKILNSYYIMWVILNWGSFACRGHLAMWFGYYNLERESVTGIWWAETRDTAKYSLRLRIAFTTKNNLIKMSIVLRLRNSAAKSDSGVNTGLRAKC